MGEKAAITSNPYLSLFDVVTPARQKKILDEFGVKLGSVAWEDIFDELKTFQTATNLEQIIIDDLSKLLARKKFNRFRSFDMNLPTVEEGKFYVFD